MTRATLPYAWYTDPEILRREEAKVFGRHWQYVGPVGGVAEPGSVVPVRVGGLPVVLTRDREGVLRAFLNVCRHRGAVLVDADGCRGSIQCPYHAWTYGLDGSLRSAPRLSPEEVARPELSLRPLSVERWGPFVFVHPEADAPPLSDTLGDLPERVAEVVDVEELRFHARAESTYRANWKICCENFLECYHCQVAHPGLSAVLDVRPGAYREEVSGLYSSQFGPVRDGAAGPGAPFDPSGEVPHGQFHFLFPNLTINIAPGRPNLSLGSVLPDGPESTTRFLDYFFAPDVDDEWIEAMLAWDDQVGREDTELVERVQRGVRSGMLEDGVVMECEELVAHFDGLLRASLA